MPIYQFLRGCFGQTGLAHTHCSVPCQLCANVSAAAPSNIRTADRRPCLSAVSPAIAAFTFRASASTSSFFDEAGEDAAFGRPLGGRNLQINHGLFPFIFGRKEYFSSNPLLPILALSGTIGLVSASLLS